MPRGAEYIKATCKPGTDVAAVWYRVAMLDLVLRHPDQRLAPHLLEGQPAPELFRAAAQTRMEWLGDELRQSWPFDIDEFLRRVRG